MGAFEREHSGIAVDLRIANSRVIEEQVRANELDPDVVGGDGIGAGEECLAAGMLDELVLIVAPDHAWARRGGLDPSALARERLLMREDALATRLERAGAPAAKASETAVPEGPVLTPHGVVPDCVYPLAPARLSFPDLLPEYEPHAVSETCLIR